MGRTWSRLAGVALLAVVAAVLLGWQPAHLAGQPAQVITLTPSGEQWDRIAVSSKASELWTYWGAIKRNPQDTDNNYRATCVWVVGDPEQRIDCTIVISFGKLGGTGTVIAEGLVSRPTSGLFAKGSARRLPVTGTFGNSYKQVQQGYVELNNNQLVIRPQ